MTLRVYRRLWMRRWRAKQRGVELTEREKRPQYLKQGAPYGLITRLLISDGWKTKDAMREANRRHARLRRDAQKAALKGRTR